MSVCVVDVLGGVVVFDNLIFNDAHAGLFDGELCERYSRLVCGDCCGFEDLVDLFLRIGCVFFLRFLNAGECGFESFDAVDSGTLCGFHCFHKFFFFHNGHFLLNFLRQ